MSYSAVVPIQQLIGSDEIIRCKRICERHFKKRGLKVKIDEPISNKIEWAPNIYATNNEKYAVDIYDRPMFVESWLETFDDNVRKHSPDINICIGYPFEVAIRLQKTIINAFLKNRVRLLVIFEKTRELELFEICTPSAGYVARKTDEIVRKLRERKCAELIGRLRCCRKGKSNWSEYEDICSAIFQTLFVPPLGRSQKQSRTVMGIRRRDFIFPNHVKSGLWFDVGNQYKGRFVLLECKNLKEKISVPEIDQTATYLSDKGLGLFAITVSRTKLDEKAEIVAISKWKDQGKLIIVLQDEHLIKMLELWSRQEDYEGIIQEQIDVFLSKVV